MSTQERLLQAVTKNAEILQALSQTEYARPALKRSSALLRHLDHEIQICDQLIEKSEAKTSKEIGDYKKYEKSTKRRFFYCASGKKEKFEERASKEEREYIEARDAERQAKSSPRPTGSGARYSEAKPRRT